MQKNTYKLILLLAALLGVTACKKEASSTKIVKLSMADNGSKITIKTDQSVVLTLGNPGDGGYEFDDPQYNGTILYVSDHQHTAPQDLSLVGDAGNDTWQFSPVHSGTTALKITATRHWAGGGTVTIFSGTITVN